MYYLDSSAIVKIYLSEAGSEWVRKLRYRSRRVEIAICEIVGAEVFAAFYRRFRSGDLSKENLQTACELFRNDYERLFVRLPVTKTVVDTGMQLIQKYPLRGYDSIQLARAISFLNQLQKLNGEILNFVGADNNLNNAARSEGLTVINPNEQS